SQLESLPNEIIHNIARYLPGRDLESLSYTSRRMSTVVNETQLPVSRQLPIVARGIHLNVNAVTADPIAFRPSPPEIPRSIPLPNEAYADMMRRLARPHITWLQRAVLGDVPGVMPRQIWNEKLPNAFSSISRNYSSRVHLRDIFMARHYPEGSFIDEGDSMLDAIYAEHLNNWQR
ncbi:F-box protein, partial [Enterobacter bugandensis]|uniref:F-box protein n=1 Tax=Enterobacter bugandensis TaxID=881260 RepID=UPI000ACF3981